MPTGFPRKGLISLWAVDEPRILVATELVVYVVSALSPRRLLGISGTRRPPVRLVELEARGRPLSSDFGDGCSMFGVKDIGVVMAVKSFGEASEVEESVLNVETLGER